MLESLNAYLFDRPHQAAGNAQAMPAIDEDGRIRLPGFPAGLSAQAYVPLVHAYARTLAASRVLDRYRGALRLSTVSAAGPDEPDQAPLTPLTPSTLLPHLCYKREDQTITRAYKVRGAVVGMAHHMESNGVRRFLTVSTGNHALGVVQAAALLRPDALRLVVPANTAFGKLQKLQTAIHGLNATGVQADLLFRGDTFDEARAWALAEPLSGAAYLDPYADPWVVAGQGTVGLELVSQLAVHLQTGAYEEIAVIAPLGGGGLLSGAATALKLACAWESAFRNVQLRFLGLRLADLNAPLGDAIRVGRLADGNAAALQALGVAIQRMDNAHMAQGVAFVRSDLGCAVEGASGGTLYPALRDPVYRPGPRRLVVSLLSGANCD